jgi:hypothetical protein
MIEINTIPTAELNVSKVAVQINSAQEFGMQFSVVGWGKFTNPEGEDVWGTTPLVSTLLNVTGESWDNWLDVDDATYVGDLALAQLGLQRAPVEEEASDDSEETTEEAAE